jgi:hypothetical protein
MHNLLFEFKEGDRIGLTDTLGNIVLSACPYRDFVTAGTGAFGVRVADSTLLYRNDGQRLPIDRVKECSGDQFGEQFIVKTAFVNTENRPYPLSGVANADGIWLIPPVLGGYLIQRLHFFITSVNIHACCSIPGLDIEKNQPGKYLIFNRQGQPVIPFAVEAMPYVQNEPYAIFRLNKKFGLTTTLGLGLEPDYDELKRLPNGWIFVRKGTAWGALRWVE